MFTLFLHVLEKDFAVLYQLSEILQNIGYCCGWTMTVTKTAIIFNLFLLALNNVIIR